MHWSRSGEDGNNAKLDGGNLQNTGRAAKQNQPAARAKAQWALCTAFAFGSLSGRKPMTAQGASVFKEA